MRALTALRRGLPALAAFLVLAQATASHAACDERTRMLAAAKAQGQANARYCGDVKEYQADVDRECGVSRKPNATPVTGRTGNGTSEPPNFPHFPNNPKPATNASDLPAACAYFTKPPVEKEGMVLHYYAVGSVVCANGHRYECSGYGGGKQWIQHGDCGVAELRVRDVKILENSQINPDIYEENTTPSTNPNTHPGSGPNGDNHTRPGS
jgi:hypothetical protein